MELTKISVDEFYEAFKKNFPDAVFTVTTVKGINGETHAFLLHGFSEKQEKLEIVVSTTVELELRKSRG